MVQPLIAPFDMLVLQTPAPTAADAPRFTPGMLVVNHVGNGIRARVLEVDPERGLLLRETCPLAAIPKGWEAAQWYADPDKCSPAF